MNTQSAFRGSDTPSNGSIAPDDPQRPAFESQACDADELAQLLANFDDLEISAKIVGLDRLVLPNGELYRQQTIATSWAFLDHPPTT